MTEPSLVCIVVGIENVSVNVDNSILYNRYMRPIGHALYSVSVFSCRTTPQILVRDVVSVESEESKRGCTNGQLLFSTNTPARPARQSCSNDLVFPVEGYHNIDSFKVGLIGVDNCTT